jgi:hypothetical protein
MDGSWIEDLCLPTVAGSLNNKQTALPQVLNHWVIRYV